MHKEKIISIILCFSIVLFSVFSVSVPKAKAWPVSISAANMIPEGLTTGTGFADLALNIASQLKDQVASVAVVAAKIAALKAVQAITQRIIGKDKTANGGGIVSDWNNYLYTSPQQVAAARMNTYFNTMSRGRSSSLNYEGVNNNKLNYDAYLRSQATQKITGNNSPTNLQEVVADPSNLFAGNNMKGITAYTKCANNPACFTMQAESKNAAYLAQATTVADKSQTNGFLPTKKNGVIVQPAALVQNAFSGLDKIGTDMIMSANFGADKFAAFGQIAAGAAVSIAARSLNYAATGQRKNGGADFPYSLSYNNKTGATLSAGGQSFSTGAVTTSYSKAGGAALNVGGQTLLRTTNSQNFVGPPAPPK